MTELQSRAGRRFRWRLPPRHSVIVLALVVAALLAGLIANDLKRGHDDAIAAAGATSRNLVGMLEEHARQSLHRVDLSMSRAADEVMHTGDWTKADPALLRQRLEAHLPQDGLVSAFHIVNRDGRIALTTLDVDAAALPSVADRDYFTMQRDRTVPGMAIGAAIKNRADGQWVLPVSLRLDGPDGKFAGVLVGRVEPAYFQRIYDAIETGRDGFVTLATRSGWMVARSPSDEKVLQRNWSHAPLFREYLAASPTGTVRRLTAVDSVDRIFSYRALADFPVVVAVGLSMNHVLASWRDLVARDAAILAVALGALFLATSAMVRQLRRREAAEAELRRLSSIVESTSDIVAIARVDGQLVYMNGAGRRAAGIGAKEDIGRYRTQQFYPPERWTFIEQVARPAALQHGVWSGENQLRALDGREGTALQVLIAHKDADGEVEYFTGVSRDITERKLRETLLDGEKLLLEMIARDAPLEPILTTLMQLLEGQSRSMLCSVLLVDADGRHLRHSAAPSLPRSYVDAIDGLEVRDGNGSCGTAAARGEMVVVEDITTDPLWDGYRELAQQHGLRACWSMPILDAQRRVLGTFAIYRRRPGTPTARHLQLIGIATDIAAVALTRRETDAALRRAVQRLEIALDGSQVSVWEYQLDRDEIWLSAGWAAYLGRPRQETRTTPAELLALVHRDEVKAVASAMQRVLNGEIESYAVEHRVAAEGGTWKWVQSRGQVIERDAAGRPLRMSGTNTDITERKQAEDRMAALATELEAKVVARTAELARALESVTAADRLKSDFMANVTHELRTPLNAIIGFAELLQAQVPGPLNAMQASFATDILSSGQQLLALVEGILDMSRLDMGSEPLEREPVSIATVLEQRLAAHADAARERGITLRLDVAPDVGMVALEPRGLQRILDALLDNAVKFNRDGGSVDVSARREPGWIEIMVADSGIGIARAHLPSLFRPLVQLDAGLARQHGGLGLGLARARRLAELQGGTIVVDSEAGKGSRFMLRLPVAG